ncbi:MAG: 2-hydroxyacid dehydrogenase [Oscillospiraceae bacterium]|jgi:phosphoglycerate dehydrogenase-like enzyme
MTRLKVVLLEPLGIGSGELNGLSARLSDYGCEFVSYDSVETDIEALKQRARDADILMLANNPLPGEVIDACPKLKYISVAFVGIDHIGQDACRSRNIHISNAAGYCTDAVAELVLGLALDCLRNISACNSAIRRGGTKNGLIGHELRGRTAGIVGTGAIGCRTAELFRAFGCRVLGYSRSQSPLAVSAGIEYVSLPQLLKESDIISIHTPLTPETKGLIAEEQINMMKKGAILINTARGPIVDTEAAARALNEGRLGALGTDVFDTEPPLLPDHVLLNAKNVVATPHVGFATEESISRRAKITFDNVYSWLDGKLINQAL